MPLSQISLLFFFNDTATTEIYTLSLHDALPISAVLKPGTKLVREWHGRAHTVMVAEDGFEFDGKRYRSLTRVARLITGVHWSGPVFFGLRKRARPASERGHE